MEDLVTLAKSTTCKRMGVASLVALGWEDVPGQTVTTFGIAVNKHLDGECKNIVGGCGCTHAEVRAIQALFHKTGAPKKLHRAQLEAHITHSPCLACARNLYEVSRLYGATLRVVYGQDYRIAEGLDYLRDHEVPATLWTRYGIL